jgi:hypothetical protein
VFADVIENKERQMASFDFQQAIEVILLKLGARAGDRYEWQLETRVGILEIQVHDTWLQTFFSDPREAALIIQKDEIDMQTGRWDWYFDAPSTNDVYSIERALTALLDAEKEKNLPILEKMTREFDAELRAKGTKIKFRKLSNSGELVATFPQGIPPASVRTDVTRTEGKLTIHPPGTPLPADHPFAQPVIIFGAKRPPPLVPTRPPDLEDIAFEILRQARYRNQ